MQPNDTPIDPSDNALQAVLPTLRKTARTGWVIIACIAVVTTGLIFLASSSSEDRVKWLIILPFMGIFASFFVAAWVRSRHEAEVMPILSQAFGLSYVKSPVRYFDMLPDNFLPRGRRQNCDDLMSGTIGGRKYQFIEVKTETGGKHSRTLFDGVVVEVATRQPLPDFLIAPVAETEGFLFFRGRVDVEEKVQVLSLSGPDGREYGLWMDANAAGDRHRLQLFMEKMLDIGASLSGGSLYSVASTNNTIFVSIRHTADLFQIGGLLATEADIMAHIRRASAQFATPLQLATDVMRA
ncbi:MAG: hypothetical protein ACRC6I_07960, partial [Paracoccaceae bacterium]